MSVIVVFYSVSKPYLKSSVTYAISQQPNLLTYLNGFSDIVDKDSGTVC